jgi:hypothetical protein
MALTEKLLLISFCIPALSFEGEIKMRAEGTALQNSVYCNIRGG